MPKVTIISCRIERLYDCPNCGGTSSEQVCCDQGEEYGIIEYADCE